MPNHRLKLTSVFTRLDNGTRLASVLFYPEVSAYGRVPEKLAQEIRRGVTRTREHLGRSELHRRHAVGQPEVREVNVQFVAPRGTASWIDPLRLTFHAVTWTHGSEAAIAYVPALEIQVVAPRAADLPRMLEDHIRFALMCENAATSLEKLVRYGRVESVRIHSMFADVEDKTPKEMAKRAGEAEEKPVLRQVATNLTHRWHPEAFGMEETVLRLTEWLTAERPRSVLLTGPSGVGKTAAVHELVRQRRSLGLGRTPFWSTSGARIVAGMTGYGMWQDRCQQLCREAAKARAVVHVGNLIELTEVGQYEGNEQGVGHFLRPYLERGDLVAIAECTPEQLRMLELEMPGMLDAFARVDVSEPDEQTGRGILRQAARATAGRTKNRCSERAVRTLDRLHRRFATYSACPGRPLRFLFNLMKDTGPGETIEPAGVTAAFSRETGLPLLILEENERLDLDQASKWFSQRVIGQDQAVDVIVDLLATIKASMARPNKPIASLMFIGPTGVGKTEMAKSLARFLYQDRRRLTRIDMTEYADFASVDRLLGVKCGPEGLLTAKVREQPFGVVLLDEFEKAHPRFFDLLLQVLGEGRLTDAAGRLADFRNSVIIMTSNLGTESFAQPAIGFGDSPEPAAHAEEHFVREVQKFVRPEMFNRIDRIVPFLPLEKATLLTIAKREMELLRRREGIQYRDLAIEFGDPLAEEVVRVGYDPRYGARPIQRAIDRLLLAPLASELNHAPGDAPLEGTVDGSQTGIRASVRVRSKGGIDLAGGSVLKPAGSLLKLAEETVQLRRQAVRVDSSHAMLDTRNQVYRLERLAHQLQRRKRRHSPTLAADAGALNRLDPLRKISDRSLDLVRRATDTEEKVLLAVYANEPLAPESADRQRAAIQEQVQSLMIDLFVLGTDSPDSLSLVVYGEHAETLFVLIRAYYALAVDRRFQVKAYAVVPRVGPPENTAERFALGDKDSDNEDQRKQANGTCLEARRIEDVDQYLTTAQRGPVGIALALAGRLAHPMLGPEAGLHVFVTPNQKQRCLVHLSGHDMRKYRPPKRIDRRDAMKNQPLRRTYEPIKQSIVDSHSGSRRRWLGGEVTDELRSLVMEHFLTRVRAWIEP